MSKNNNTDNKEPADPKIIKISREAHRRVKYKAFFDDSSILEVVSSLILKHVPSVRTKRKRNSRLPVH